MTLLGHRRKYSNNITQSTKCSFFYRLSDDSKSRRTDVRIPRDNSLMVEGHHFGADEHREEQRVPWEKKELSSPSTISLDSGHESLVIKTKGVQTFRDFCL